MNTKDEEIISTRNKVREIIFSHDHVTQMHGFYLDKEKKTLRFDVVISFDADNRNTVFHEVIEDVKKAFPEYEIHAALDTDFAEE